MEQALNSINDKWWKPGFLALEWEVTKGKGYDIHVITDQVGDISINYLLPNRDIKISMWNCV